MSRGQLIEGSGEKKEKSTLCSGVQGQQGGRVEDSGRGTRRPKSFHETLESVKRLRQQCLPVPAGAHILPALPQALSKHAITSFCDCLLGFYFWCWLGLYH